MKFSSTPAKLSLPSLLPVFISIRGPPNYSTSQEHWDYAELSLVTGGLDRTYQENPVPCRECNDVSARDRGGALPLEGLLDRVDVLEVSHPEAPLRILLGLNPVGVYQQDRRIA